MPHQRITCKNTTLGDAAQECRGQLPRNLSRALLQARKDEAENIRSPPGTRSHCCLHSHLDQKEAKDGLGLTTSGRLFSLPYDRYTSVIWSFTAIWTTSGGCCENKQTWAKDISQNSGQFWDLKLFSSKEAQKYEVFLLFPPQSHWKFQVTRDVVALDTSYSGMSLNKQFGYLGMTKEVSFLTFISHPN